MTTIDAGKLLDLNDRIVAGGMRLADEVVRALEHDDVVQVDLRGMRGLSSSFFNILLDRVIPVTSRDGFDRRVKMCFDTAAQASIFKRSFDAVRVAKSATTVNGKVPFGTFIRLYAGWPYGHDRAEVMLTFLARRRSEDPPNRWSLYSSDVGPDFEEVQFDATVSAVLQLKRRILVQRHGAVIVGAGVTFRPRKDCTPYADRNEPLPEFVHLGKGAFRIKSIPQGDVILVFTRVHDRDDGRIAFPDPRDAVFDDYPVVAYGANRWDAFERLREGLGSLGPA